MQRVEVVDDVREVAALVHPVRIAALAALRGPDSAAGVARTIGQTRQLVNYHLKELERAGLVVSAGERRKGNFVEQLYQAVASTFVVSSRLAWGGIDRDRALQDQAALQHLVTLGERIQHDASALLDRAAFDGDEISSATVDADVRFADEDARSAFMTEYLAVLGPLLKKHGSRRGGSYRVAMAVYPQEEHADEQ